MGYEANSPVKQIWLPLEYSFIDGSESGTFGNFAKEYKKKYGIDLHDIFGYIHDAEQHKNGIYIKENSLISSYSVGNDYFKGHFVTPNAVLEVIDNEQFTTESTLLRLGVVTNGVQRGFGVTFQTGQTEVDSIDDLIVHLYEI